MVHQNHQVVIIDTLLTVMTEGALVDTIVTVIPNGTAMTEIMTEKSMRAQVTIRLAMVTHHPATVVLTQKGIMVHQGVVVLATVAVGIHLVAKAMREASVIQVIPRQETKALMAIIN